MTAIVKVLRAGGLRVRLRTSAGRLLDTVLLFAGWPDLLADLLHVNGPGTLLTVDRVVVRRERLIIRGRWGWPVQAGEMLNRLGVRRLPDEGMPERLVDGVPVFVLPKRVTVNSVGRRRHMSGLRVMARCECGRVVPVGRLGQHVCDPSDLVAARCLGESGRCGECGGFLGDHGECVTVGCKGVL